MWKSLFCRWWQPWKDDKLFRARVAQTPSENFPYRALWLAWPNIGISISLNLKPSLCSDLPLDVNHPTPLPPIPPPPTPVLPSPTQPLWSLRVATFATLAFHSFCQLRATSPSSQSNCTRSKKLLFWPDTVEGRETEQLWEGILSVLKKRAKDLGVGKEGGG